MTTQAAKLNQLYNSISVKPINGIVKIIKIAVYRLLYGFA
ncbi:hypothetical protein VCRA2119O52_1100011 [Vibrio crassostreae]|nr:hypothetical protein VCRA2119O52_1100011 [Vibrio crassostreae]